jgi:ribosome-binding factor A
MSERIDRLNQMFKREVSNMILMGDISDPRVKFVTITYADISKDLSWAHIGFSVLLDEPKAVEDAQAGLNSARSRVRRLLSERVVVRYMPQIKFVHDTSIADSFKMTKTLEGIRKEREVQEGVAGDVEEDTSENELDDEGEDEGDSAREE